MRPAPLLLALVLGLFALATAPGAQAAVDPSAALVSERAAAGCACDDDLDALRALRERIADAPSADAARDLALAETRLASVALGRARTLAPWSGALATAHDRLDAYTTRVAFAATPGDVASEFAQLVRLDAPRADVDCDYTTGEIIAIVLGFILGIIPGIILLILLC